MGAKTKIIEVRAIEHNKQNRLALYFPIDKELIALFKTQLRNTFVRKWYRFEIHSRNFER
jgi:hypothetical protein